MVGRVQEARTDFAFSGEQTTSATATARVRLQCAIIGGERGQSLETAIVCFPCVIIVTAPEYFPTSYYNYCIIVSIRRCVYCTFHQVSIVIRWLSLHVFVVHASLLTLNCMYACGSLLNAFVAIGKHVGRREGKQPREGMSGEREREREKSERRASARARARRSLHVHMYLKTYGACSGSKADGETLERGGGEKEVEPLRVRMYRCRCCDAAATSPQPVCVATTCKLCGRRSTTNVGSSRNACVA